jgi:rubrerythrin
MTEPKDFYAAAAALGTIEALDVDAMRLLFKVERTGEDFYNGIADRIGDPRAADLLRKNGREERGHAERVRKAIGQKLGHPWEPLPDDLAHYPVALPDTIPAAMFSIIVQGELDGDVGYERWAARESDPEVQRLLRLNAREETGHAERVREVMAILEQKAAGG